jgi:hypothetical protein
MGIDKAHMLVLLGVVIMLRREREETGCRL